MLGIEFHFVTASRHHCSSACSRPYGCTDRGSFSSSRNRTYDGTKSGANSDFGCIFLFEDSASKARTPVCLIALASGLEIVNCIDIAARPSTRPERSTCDSFLQNSTARNNGSAVNHDILVEQDPECIPVLLTRNPVDPAAEPEG